jgi:CheY-like chemotaxis protein
MNRKKILVVDDDAVVTTRLSLLLKHHGYDTVTAVDGAGAVSIARHEIPNLIILDISFPPDVAHGGGVPWDGFLIIDWLRRLEEAKNIPIIVITGSPQKKYQEQAKAKGALAFFQKPIDEREMVALIQKTIGEGTLPPAPPPPPLPTA